jgi:hypothetical protein
LRVFAEEEDEEADGTEGEDDDARSEASERSGGTEISGDEEDIPPGIAPTAPTKVCRAKHASPHWTSHGV